MVNTLKHRAAAGNVDRNEDLKLLHNTVTECNPELLDNVVVKLLDKIKIALVDGVFCDRLLVERVKVGVAEPCGRCIGCVERNALAIDVDSKRTVVYLIRNGKGRIVVVSRTDVPGVLGDKKLSVAQVLRVVYPRGRNELYSPLVKVGHFHNREHFRKVILNSRYVKLVEYNYVNVIVI